MLLRLRPCQEERSSTCAPVYAPIFTLCVHRTAPDMPIGGITKTFVQKAPVGQHSADSCFFLVEFFRPSSSCCWVLANSIDLAYSTLKPSAFPRNEIYLGLDICLRLLFCMKFPLQRENNIKFMMKIIPLTRKARSTGNSKIFSSPEGQRRRRGDDGEAKRKHFAASQPASFSIQRI